MISKWMSLDSNPECCASRIFTPNHKTRINLLLLLLPAPLIFYYHYYLVLLTHWLWSEPRLTYLIAIISKYIFKLIRTITCRFCFFVFVFVLFWLFLLGSGGGALHSLRDLSSLTRDQTQALGSESTESWPLDCPGSPQLHAFDVKVVFLKLDLGLD